MQMKIRLIRHATLVIELDGKRLLVDPQLDPAGARPPIDNTPNPRPNPLVELPIPAAEVLAGIDAILVTHLHRDHLDATAEELLPRRLPVFCQPEDLVRLRELGFDARPVIAPVQWQGLSIHRTAVRHGTGAIGDRMAPASGYVIGPLYIAGDSIWCDEVEEAIGRHSPRVAVVNAGAARFLTGDPIVMDAAGVAEVARRVPEVVAVHMEAVNHCLLTRAELRQAVPGVHVPEDGAELEFPA